MTDQRSRPPLVYWLYVAWFGCAGLVPLQALLLLITRHWFFAIVLAVATTGFVAGLAFDVRKRLAATDWDNAPTEERSPTPLAQNRMSASQGGELATDQPPPTDVTPPEDTTVQRSRTLRDWLLLVAWFICAVLGPFQAFLLLRKGHWFLALMLLIAVKCFVAGQALGVRKLLLSPELTNAPTEERSQSPIEQNRMPDSQEGERAADQNQSTDVTRPAW